MIEYFMSTPVEMSAIPIVHNLHQFEPKSLASALDGIVSDKLENSFEFEENQQIMAFVIGNQANFGQVIEQSDKETKTSVIKSMVKLRGIFSYDEELSECIDEILNSHKQEVEELLDTDDYFYPLFFQIQNGGMQGRGAVTWLTEHSDKVPDFIDQIKAVFPDNGNAQDTFCIGLLNVLGIDEPDSRKIITSWMVNFQEPNIWSNYVRPNIAAVIELERIRPKSVHLLRSIYGIGHFNRYNEQELVEQLEPDNQKHPNIVIFTGWYDIPADEKPEHKFNYSNSSVAKEIKANGGRTIFAEFNDNPQEAAQTLHNIHQRHGQVNVLLWRFHSENKRAIVGWEWRINPNFTSANDYWRFHWKYLPHKQMIKYIVPAINQVMDNSGQVILGICQAQHFVNSARALVTPAILYSEGNLKSLNIVGNGQQIVIQPEYVDLVGNPVKTLPVNSN